MAVIKKLKSRGPSTSIAKALAKRRSQKNGLKASAAAAEAKARKAGGYGKAVVSVWDVPKGGIEKSPAYRKLLTRCELDAKGKPPPPELRDGAAIKGGYPIEKYPPNVVIDAWRAPWLPDDFAQVMKNTGPGGVYHGWMGPEGKFYYHRCGNDSSIEAKAGRKLGTMDGINSLKRMVRRLVPAGADQKFLKDCLTANERKHVLPAKAFHFGIVSAKRADKETGQYDILVVENHLQQVGVKPTWYVDAESLKDYKALGLNAKVGGKLVPARNMVLDDAKKVGKVAVEVSDDISKWTYIDCAKQDLKGDFKKINAALAGTPKYSISPLAAAQFMVAKMRTDPDKPKLAGVFPTGNAAMTICQDEIGKHTFILGDFFVAEPSSSCRFDPAMTLKEDYDYTCSHMKAHGSVLRCNRITLTVKHATNPGGAVDARDKNGAKERANIKILNDKWPGVFRINANRKGGPANSEVKMNWSGYKGHTADVKKDSKAKVAGKKTFVSKVKKANLKKKSA